MAARSVPVGAAFTDAVAPIKAAPRRTAAVTVLISLLQSPNAATEFIYCSSSE
jgi:hypothetical protein